MTFTTATFAVFLVVVFALHWAARTCRGQNLVILVASYVFYGWWDATFCGLLLASSLLDFFVSLAIAATPEGARRRRRLLVATSCAANLGVLGVFKYYDFFVASFAAMLRDLGFAAEPPLLHLVLPVGISFYTFQTLGYTIDVARGHVRASRSLVDYLAYVSFFPQLVAGPIERAGNLLPQLEHTRRFDEAQARDGARQMLWGLAKKLVIADQLGLFVQQIYAPGASEVASGPVLMAATVAFAIQIYCDFSGYSDLAIGTAKLFGVQLVRNFDQPYFSRSVVEFWRRWHMSLSTWFRDYVYVPLGGNRHGPARQRLALMITFTLSGAWHGAAWTFVAWGVINGLFVVIAGVLPRPRTSSRLVATLQRLATFGLVCTTWVFFRAVDLDHALAILGRIATDVWHPAAWSQLAVHDEFLRAFAPLVAIAAVLEWRTRAHEHPLAAIVAWPRPLRWTIYTVMLWSALYLMPDDPNTFLYFQF